MGSELGPSCQRPTGRGDEWGPNRDVLKERGTGTLLLQPSRGLAKAVGHLSPQLSLLLTRSREAAF